MLLPVKRHFCKRFRDIFRDDDAQLYFGLWLIAIWLLVFVLFYLKPFTPHK
jgi:hypothetical protein